MKFAVLSPSILMLAGISTAYGHKFYRSEEHQPEAHVARFAEELQGRGFLNPMAEHYPRQAPSASSAAVPSAVSSIAGSASGVLPSGAPVATASFSYSLASTNPTAIPLSSINAAAPSAPTGTFASTPAVGAVPADVQGAPGIPAPSLVISSYPALDQVPSVDSPEVKQWVAEVQSSGIQIPGFPQTVEGGCAANAQAAADPNRCWWTCTGCVRPTDISDCPDKNTWGLTYDDGPAPYTPNLLEYLDEHQLKSTFFVVGSRVLSYPSMLQHEYLSGHQISVHTWSHRPLTSLSNEQIIAELGWTKKVIKDVLGVTPNTMRPPFGDIDDRVRAICSAMNLTPILWTRISATQTLDTDDFDIHGGLATVDQVLHNWQNILGNVSSLNHGFIVLEHDLFQQSVEVATGYILPDAIARGQFKIMPVTSCLNKPMSDSYIETNNNQTNPPPVKQEGVVTLSSGAPGSAQATSGAASQSGNGASQVLLDRGLVAVLLISSVIIPAVVLI